MTYEEVKEIYDKYYVGMHWGGSKIEKATGIEHTVLYKNFKKYGFKMRDNREKNLHVNTINEDFFHDINTEPKAYWLGFLSGDGYISAAIGNGQKKVGIALQDSDTEHLEKFKITVGTDAPIRHYRQTSGYNYDSWYCRIIIPSDIMAEDLISHGCIEHKTDRLEAPTIESNLQRHWIRGYMDANGSISMSKSYNWYAYKIRFAATEEVLKWIQEVLKQDNIIQHDYPMYKRKEGQIVSQWEFGGNKLVRKYLDYIYDGATVWLDRKYERYQMLIDHYKEEAS